MENAAKVNANYHIARAFFEPLYLVRRSREIIREQERVNGESPAKGLVMAVSVAYDAAKIAVGSAIAYSLADRLF